MNKNSVSKNNILKIFPSLIIFLNLCMNFAFLSKENLSNEYYTAAVKSMLANFKNFFFVSFDPVGFLTVDKPPLGLWIQALSAKIFGLNSFSILLPSIFSSAVVCFLIYKIMAENFGWLYAIIAQIIFCFTPIITALTRTNNLDMTLMLFMMLAIYFAIKAQTNFLWFILSMIMLGLAFNIKMFQAYMIAPALFLYFIMVNKFSLRTFIKCIIAGFLLLIISFSWTLIVEMTPKDSRPFIGGSGNNNSVISLMFGHNGFERLTGKKFDGKNKNQFTNLQPPHKNLQQPFQNDNGNKKKSGGFDEIGRPNFLRLFNLSDASMYEQISWFLIPALICIAAVFFARKILQPKQIKIIILLAACLIPMLIFFSIAEFFHRYYLAMMAPSIACLSGALCYILKNKSDYLILILFCITFFIQKYFVFQNEQALLLLVMATEFILCAILYFLRYKIKMGKKIWLTASFISLITAPITWSFFPVLGQVNSVMPAAQINKNAHHFSNKNPANNNLKNFLLENASDEKYFLAVSNCNQASNLILNTNLNIISVNGFEGTDNILTLEKLKSWVQNKQIKYYMLGSNTNDEISNWVRENAKLVYSDKNFGDSPENHNGHQLYSFF